MFLRRNKNRSGSTSVQLIVKEGGKNRVLRTIGCGVSEAEIEELLSKGRQEIRRMSGQVELFPNINEALIEAALSQLSNSSIRTLGPEVVFGRIFDSIGFGSLGQDLFRHLVIARLAYPVSKLKTVDYLYRYQGVQVSISSIYRFLDKLSGKLKPAVEQLVFARTRKILGQKLNVVFYDLTTLYFEASDEDDLRKTGFSKDGKAQHPQIFLGLLVGMGGYAIGYEIYEGNTYEGDTLIPFLDKTAKKFGLGKPTVVADAGLLSKNNIAALEERGYKYVLGGRIKNETKKIKLWATSHKWKNGDIRQCKKDKHRIIVSYSSKRAAKDAHNRKRGLLRLEKKVSTGKLTKSNINNRGYNKYLKLKGEIAVEIDYEKYKKDQEWDGLKCYITNSKKSRKKVVEQYTQLWHIEKAFRMSKTDLRIRPIYHRLRNRIEAHICISFVAYSVYKDLERALKKEKSTISIERAAQLTHNMYQITYKLPVTQEVKTHLLKMDHEQQELYDIVQKHF